ncbi:putative uncharacterized protein [Roseburia sp. CAG:100]|nr:putative uncharacterized protein [Roseburia sp. CAG:100]
MHIAICDDNIADRKHLERLLSRESDKRMGTPNLLYVDSYGDREHFLFHPLMYDMIFMDMSESPALTAEIVATITEMGFTAPIVLYSSKIDYTQLPDLPPNVIHQKKPYLPDPLPELLALGDAHVQGHIETISVHLTDGYEHYIPVRDIIYYTPREDGNALYMKDGTFVAVTEDAGQVQLLTEPYKEFCRINKKVIVNMRFISMLTPITVMMQDYREFHYSPFRYSELKFLREEVNDMD